MNDAQALVTTAQEMATAESLYGALERRKEFFEAISSVAPWVKGKYPMDSKEIVLVCRKAMAMGLDPLNPHEVQIWKDHHGVQFQLAYTLMREWVQHFKGQHTEPQFERLTEHELIDEGMDTEDVAYRVTFVMLEDIPKIKGLMEAGYEPGKARRMFEVTGLGVATAEEYAGDYFAPKGRSRAWKVKKRAVTDAYRTRFGTPSRPEIVELRRMRGDANLTLDDWRVAAQTTTTDLQLEAARDAAEMRAWRRELEANGQDPDKVLARGRELISGRDETKPEWSKSQQEPEPEPESQSAPAAPFEALSDKPEIFEAATAETPKGQVIGHIGRRKLSQIIDYVNALEDPNDEAIALRKNVATCLAYLADYEDCPTVYATLAEERSGDVDPAKVVKELRFASGWMLRGEEWIRGEPAEPEAKAIQRAAAIIGDAVGGDDDKRHDLLAVVFDESSTKGLNAWEIKAITDRWVREDDAWKANNVAFFEAHAILEASGLPGVFADTL